MSLEQILRRTPLAIETGVAQSKRFERHRLEGSFWPAAMETLKESDTTVLRRRVFSIADAAPNVSPEAVQKVVGKIEKAYSGEPRKFTSEAEVNHAYRVAILTAHAIGWKNLTSDTFTTAIGHDYKENTPHPLADLTIHDESMVPTGVSALSHSENNVFLYPNRDDIRPYLADLLQTDQENPDLKVSLIKVMDQIAVANDPVDETQLAGSAYKKRWERTTDNKLKEMEQFEEMFTQIAPHKAYERRLLREAIAFTKLRTTPDEAADMLDQVLFERQEIERSKQDQV